MEEITAVRHGESTANAASARAVRDGLAVRIDGRDADIGLSGRGREQAAAVGRLLAGLPDDALPESVWCSPYRRARLTWEIAREGLRAAGRPLPAERVDDRLRDRVLGVFELLTPRAIEERFPAERREMERIGLPFYRPPGGESFADVAVRIREVLDDAGTAEAGRRVLVVAHDAVVLLIRHVLGGGTPDDVGRIFGYGQVANGSVSRWRRRGGRMDLVSFGDTGHLPPEIVT
ncbi:histidine phosphatase family protein [Microbispora corallina]|uniref:Phosphoglycerate mutase n=1 Tax=Microbispora corallina TaxID=83302 RepID=A0ABQ4G903_9ACTN|nr:histidine phosphatase family protein [Microbispora corallina]GIH43544.1 phosphoglycerate mutase [Microbispora corallina]